MATTICYLGNFSLPHNTECHIADALSAAGCTVHRLQESKFDRADFLCRVSELVGSSAAPLADGPIVLLFAKGRLRDTDFGTGDPRLLAELLSEVKAATAVNIIACWIFDLLCAEFSTSRFIWAATISEACDIFFTTDGYTASRYELPNSVVLRQAMPAGFHQYFAEPRETFTCDIAHLGSVYGERGEWSDALERYYGERYRIFENVRGADVFSLCRSAKIIVGPPYPMFDEYWSNRIYLVAGHGGCFACPTVKGMRQDGWVPGRNYFELSIKSTQAMLDNLDWLLDAGDAYRRSMAQQARELVESRHLFKHRIERMLDAIGAKYLASQTPQSLSAAPLDYM